MDVHKFNNHTLDKLDDQLLSEISDDAEVDTLTKQLIEEVGEETAWELVALIDDAIQARVRKHVRGAVSQILRTFACWSTTCAAMYHVLMPSKESFQLLADRVGSSKQAIHKQEKAILKNIPGGRDQFEKMLKINEK